MAGNIESSEAQTVAGASDEGLRPGTESTRGESFAVPASDIYETDNELVLVADVPGVGKDGVELKVEDRVLEITAYRKKSEGKPTYQEFLPVSYHRAFTLSDGIDVEKIDAQIRDGVLSVTLPKSPRAKLRRIEVHS